MLWPQSVEPIAAGEHREGDLIANLSDTRSRERKHVVAYQWSGGKGVTIHSQAPE